jgi:hypothetical protein
MNVRISHRHPTRLSEKVQKHCLAPCLPPVLVATNTLLGALNTPYCFVGPALSTPAPRLVLQCDYG